MEQTRVDKYLSREFVPSILGALLLSAAYFFKGGVEFSDYGFWVTMALGIAPVALTVQKAAGSLSRSKE